MTGATMQAASSSGSFVLPSSKTVARVGLGAPKTASIQFLSNGEIRNHNSIKIDDWFIPSTTGIGSAYEIIADSASPDTPDGGAAMDTWLPLSSSRTWSETRSTTGVDLVTFNVRIRSAGSGTVLGTCAVTLRAEVTI